jgi:hypothetical protein
MSVTFVITTSDKAVRKQRRDTASKVIKYFAEVLPDLRLKVILDCMEWDEIKANGEENRGLFALINEHEFHDMNWPLHFRDRLAIVNEQTLKISYTCDAAIYLHNSTCESTESLTMTLAHEMQHFVQYGNNRTIFAFNNLILKLPRRTLAELGLTWHDIPTEREARIIAKRASEELLGTEATKAYINDKVRTGTIPRDVADWTAIREIDTTAELAYDPTVETHRLFQRLRLVRPALEEELTKLRHLPAYAELNLDDAFNPE